MKTNFLAIRSMALVVASCHCIPTGFRAVLAEEVATEADFPYVIPYEPGTSAFAGGDHITITSVLGNRKHLEPDGSYLVQGAYTLASVDSADILFSCTTHGQNGPTPITEGQDIKETPGRGTFSLKHKTPCYGWFHVSFYVTGEGQSHGGIYFGEKGSEKTILRKTDWPDFYRGAEGEKRAQAPDTAGTGETRFSTEPNRAIVAYLGNPVPAPADLDPKYSPGNLTAAFSAISEKAGWPVKKLAVDDSEFPFLVYGTLAGKHRLPESVFRETKGYSYGGSVVGTTDGGSTYFALNIIPNDQYPSGQMEACNRRLMVRLQILADAARHLEQYRFRP